MVGWYDTIKDVGEFMASSATAVVKLCPIFDQFWIRKGSDLGTYSIARRIRLAFGRGSGASYG